MFLLCWILVFGGPSCALGASQILNIRHWVAPDHTRVVIDMTEDASFTVEKGERTLAVDLEDSSVSAGLAGEMILKKPGVEKIALFPRSPSGVRVVLTLPDSVQTTVFKLKKFQDKPYRIVVDLVLPDAAKQASEAREQIKVTRKARVVVIDPGHGGDAPGAVGKQGTCEKDVVLAISKKLRDLLNGREGYRAFLTRDGDYYVSFNKRLMIAREYGADLFVSIHADAARNREASGSSVYCLSTGAASSEAAKILARNENLADVVGGVPAVEGSDVTDPIILDMFQTHTINQSRNFGGVLLGELGATNRLKFATVQEAPLRVLKLPEIPSILVETAYISNAKEEKLLGSERFQTRIAEGVARSIVEFLPPLAAANASFSTGKDEEPKLRAASTGKAKGTAKAAPVGKRSPAAPVQFQTSLPPADAAPLAGKDEEPKQKAASPGKAKVEAKATSVGKRSPATPVSKAERSYRVKRGDTLGAIAAKHGTTIPVLMEINHLKRAHPLYVGLKLVLPKPYL